MSKILNWVIRSTKVVQENVQRDGWKHVARRYWNNYGQLRFGKLVGEDEFGNRCDASSLLLNFFSLSVLVNCPRSIRAFSSPLPGPAILFDLLFIITNSRIYFLI